jgi:hypothetical protein
MEIFMSVPDLSDQDRKAALDKAAATRKARATIREQLKQGSLSLAEVLARSNDPVVGKMRVQTLLESLPGFGKARATRLMKDIGIAENRRVQGLGERQRTEMLRLLDEAL